MARVLERGRRAEVGLLAAAGLLASIAAPERTSAACSCMGPELRFISPMRADAAPLNTHVRFEIPAPTGPSGRMVVRARNGSEVPVTPRTFPQGGVTLVDLEPRVPLLPGTRYEVAELNPLTHPSTVVIGTFKTGAARDVTPPRLDALGIVKAHKNQTMITTCDIAGPWITLAGIRASDPDRPDAQLMYEVWAGDAAGRVDPARTPDAILAPYRETVTLGRSSGCDVHDFPLAGATVTIGIAAIDEAGNRSAVQRTRVDMTKATPSSVMSP